MQGGVGDLMFYKFFHILFPLLLWARNLPSVVGFFFCRQDVFWRSRIIGIFEPTPKPLKPPPKAWRILSPKRPLHPLASLKSQGFEDGEVMIRS